MAGEAGIEIEFTRKRNFRKGDRVNEILARRGEQAGQVCIFSAKQTGKTYLVPDDGSALHYDFYFRGNWACAMTESG